MIRNDPDPADGLSDEERLNDALDCLDEAIDELMPRERHADQRPAEALLRARELLEQTTATDAELDV